jgi:soluble lytic murein transglycosylase-like protein
MNATPTIPRSRIALACRRTLAAILSLTLGLALALCPSRAMSTPSPKSADIPLLERERKLERHFDGPCRKLGVPKALAMAIARQESSMNPLAVNISGKDHYPRDVAHALELVDRAKRKGLSYDIGVMQINSYWIRKYDIPHRAMLDPGLNIHMGCLILRQQIDRHGLTWMAVGRYHSGTPRLRDAYAKRVKRHLLDILAEYER